MLFNCFFLNRFKKGILEKLVNLLNVFLCAVNKHLLILKVFELLGPIEFFFKFEFALINLE